MAEVTRAIILEEIRLVSSEMKTFKPFNEKERRLKETEKKRQKRKSGKREKMDRSVTRVENMKSFKIFLR